jgi:septal ring factor EnvC (AmiA/AmiB activator)
LAFTPAEALAAVPAAGSVGRNAGAGSPTLAVPPIVGRRAGDEADGDDARHRGGILLETSVAQTVSAPAAGTVVFAGSFRGFGLLLNIDRGDGYHILLSGCRASTWLEARP